jgi:hypothetical protein
MSLFERISTEDQRLLAEANEVSYKQATTAAREALKKVKLRSSSRKAVVKAVVDALASHDVLMTYLHSDWVKKKRIGYHTLGDLLGDMMWDFKRDHGLYGDDYEELSRDDGLSKGLNAKLARWKKPAKLTIKLGPDYDTAKHAASMISSRVDSLMHGSFDEKKHRGEIKTAIGQLKRALQLR